MAEKYTPSTQPENQKSYTKHGPSIERLDKKEAVARRIQEASPPRIERARRAATTESLDTNQLLGELARPSKRPQQESEIRITYEIKQMAYDRLLVSARRHLSPPSRLVSHIVHQPIIDTVSEISAKTIARPSGILSGGIMAFAGTLIYYYIAKHYGYSYNSFIFLALLGTGFCIGWIFELLYRIFKTVRHR